MKVVNVTPVGKQKVYDISVKDAEHYFLENGVVSHNTGIYYSANAIWIIGRSQEKDSEGVQGYNFTINIEKSRFVKEKSKLIFQVMFESGISKWSGLLDMAMESGHVIKPKNGWYQRVGEEKNYREKDTMNKDFWLPILTDSTFQEWVKDRYQLAGRMMYNSDFTSDDE